MRLFPRLSIGYQDLGPNRFVALVERFRQEVDEVYFPGYQIADGRGSSIVAPEARRELERDLVRLRTLGIKLNLLINANCYGVEATTDAFKKKVERLVAHLEDLTGLDGVTTTSLFVAQVVKAAFPDIEIRASINMGIGSVSGLSYVKAYFDSYYLQRELNRHPDQIRTMKAWCEANGKKLFVLANSGCLRHCSARTFHDNLVAHESEIDWTTSRNFQGVCWEYLASPENRCSFIRDSTWIRPEDLAAYGELVDGVKLATRTTVRPETVVESYARGSYDGNMLALCEPDFSGLCHLDNTRFPPNWMASLRACADAGSERECSQEIFNHVGF